jgi:hypothetical protein
MMTQSRKRKSRLTKSEWLRQHGTEHPFDLVGPSRGYQRSNMALSTDSDCVDRRTFKVPGAAHEWIISCIGEKPQIIFIFNYPRKRDSDFEGNAHEYPDQRASE